MGTNDPRLTDAREWSTVTMSQRIRQNVADYTYSKTDIDNKDNTRVPTSRTVNGKALSANITLTAADLGTMTTAQINTAISQLQTQINNLPALLSGTNEPTTTTGKAGDWYVVY